MRTYKAMLGQHYAQVAEAMVRLAKDSGETVTCKLNGVLLTAAPGMTAETVTGAYDAECQRQRREREASGEAAREQAEVEAHWEGRKRALAAALKYAPAEPTLVSKDVWEEWLAAQDSDYERAVFRYAANWARLMESRLAGPNPQRIEECAEEASQLADDEGFTGAMVGMARSILERTWVHGEELARWHRAGEVAQ
jgi:hypothetical protein